MGTTTSALKIIRTARGLTQAQLAKVTHSYQQRLSKVERGSEPTEIEVELLSRALSVPPSKIFPERFR